ncbi:hypothetical protein D3C72_1666950 [compost metagenome]
MALRAQTLHIAPCLRGGDPLAFTAGHRRATVKRGAQLQLNVGKAGPHPLEKPLIQRLSIVHHQPVADVDAFLLQAIKTAPRHLRVRVLHGGHHARHACGN